MSTKRKAPTKSKMPKKVVRIAEDKNVVHSDPQPKRERSEEEEESKEKKKVAYIDPSLQAELGKAKDRAWLCRSCSKLVKSTAKCNGCTKYCCPSCMKTCCPTKQEKTKIPTEQTSEWKTFHVDPRPLTIHIPVGSICVSCKKKGDPSSFLSEV